MNHPTDQFQIFLRGELISNGWDHLHLIRMAAVACQQFPGQEIELIRQGLTAINARFMKPGHEGYHHTLTCMWIELVKLWLNEVGLTSDDLWNDLSQAFYDSRIPLQFYSQQRLDSQLARVEYLKPDLAPLRLPTRLGPTLAPLWRRFCLQEIQPQQWDAELHNSLAEAAQVLYGGQGDQVLAAGIHKLQSKYAGHRFACGTVSMLALHNLEGRR